MTQEEWRSTRDRVRNALVNEAKLWITAGVNPSDPYWESLANVAMVHGLEKEYDLS